MWWHALVHAIGADYGAPYGRWVPYDFLSGSGSDLGEITLIGAALAVWKRFTCYTWWCPRHAAYDFTDAGTGLTHRLCRHCHPQHPGHRLTRNHIARIHARNQGGGGDGPPAAPQAD